MASHRRCSPRAVRDLVLAALLATVVAAPTPITPAPYANILVGVVGAGDQSSGAKLSLWNTSTTGVPEELITKTYTVKEYPKFNDAFAAFMAEADVKANPPKAASLAVAGPVENNTVVLTNLNWTVNGNALQQKYGFKVAVLNDFEALGYGIPMLKKGEDFDAVNDVARVWKAPIGVIGPSGGLGQAQLIWDPKAPGYRVVPGEGGHMAFAPRGWKQRALAAYAESEVGYLDTEEVCSYRGLELVYKFLCSDRPANRPEVLPCAQPNKTYDQIAADVDTDPLAYEAVDMVLGILGNKAADLALSIVAKGGIFVAPGLVTENRVHAEKTHALKTGYLSEGFLRPRFVNMLRGIPLFVITNDNVTQLGAMMYARRNLLV